MSDSLSDAGIKAAVGAVTGVATGLANVPAPQIHRAGAFVANSACNFTNASTHALKHHAKIGAALGAPAVRRWWLLSRQLRFLLP